MATSTAQQYMVVSSENMEPGDRTSYRDVPVTIASVGSTHRDHFGREMIHYTAKTDDGRVGTIIFGPGIQLAIER